MANFSKRDIQLAIGQPAFGRGEAYFSQNRVLELNVEVIDDDYVILRSKVKGSGYDYVQEISIEDEGTYARDIVGECSCPVSFNCKHVVAACLAYQAGFTSQTKSTAKETDNGAMWLERYVVAGEEKPAINKPSDSIIAYLLDHGLETGALKIMVVQSRIGKNGALTRGRQLSPVNRYQQLSNSQDRQIVSLLEAMKGGAGIGSTGYPLKGELGAVCLTSILKTGRSYWQETSNQPLSLSAGRDVSFEWLDKGDGAVKLNISVTPAARILNTTPAFYLDEQLHTAGPIYDADYTSEQWGLLLDPPSIKKEKQLEFSRLMLSRLPESQIPLPVEVMTRKINEASPIPVLALKEHEVQHSSTQTTYEMQLHFEYEGIEISASPALPVQNVSHNDEIVTISRDLQTEQAMQTRLMEKGFSEHPQVDQKSSWQPLANSPLEIINLWKDFIQNTIPLLEAEGWLISFADNFGLAFVAVDDWHIDISSDTDWFELGFDIEVDNKKVPLLPMIIRLLQEYELDDLPNVVTVQLEDERYIELGKERIEPIVKVLFELFDRESPPAANHVLKLGRFDAARIAALDQALEASVTWHGNQQLLALGKQLRDFDGIRKVEIPSSTTVVLRDYQKSGVDWLQFLREYQFNGILADDMGLGKTVQTLIHLLIEKEAGRLLKPCLIVAPTTLMSNWRREIENFAPSLDVLVLHGANRHASFPSINNHDVVVTTYPLIVRDFKILSGYKFYYLILDEAQTIKNPTAKISQSVKKLSTSHRLCLTGTPMENHLGELWSLFDFLMPGFLGTRAAFTHQIRKPIEKDSDEERQDYLSARVSPFMLRRRKSEVARELPPKTEIIRTVILEDNQAALYESIRLSMEKKVREAIQARGMAQSHITILDALLKLRQTCCDPRLLKLEEAKHVTNSAKLELLMSMLDEMLEEGRKILVFSQFTEMLGLIELKLNENSIKYTKLTGQTRKRDEAIEKFRDGSVSVFLISLKAGGVGLNLTEADTVIHYDPWWNPAAENQATDRAHRIGQDKPVFVYKLIAERTLEEKILEMQDRKQVLADSVYDRAQSGASTNLSNTDLEALFSPIQE